ncbi:2774_t:CDS:2, partial [Acaulospora colombiana]
SESERALLKLSGKNMSQVFAPPPVLNLGGIVFGGPRPSTSFSSPQRQSTTAIASTSGTSNFSDLPSATSPQTSFRTDASTSRLPAPQPISPIAEPAQATHVVTNILHLQPKPPSTTLPYHLGKHKERSQVLQRCQEEDAEWVAVALERHAEMLQDREDLREREIARAIEVQTETGVDLGYGLELSRNDRYRVVRVGEQQSAPLFKDPPPSNEIVIKEEEVEVRLERPLEPILNEEIELYEEQLFQTIEGILGRPQQEYAESECSYDETPQPTRVTKAVNHNGTTTAAVAQGPSSSQTKKSKFGQRDSEDDLDSLSSLTSEESAPAPKKRKLNKKQAIDERETTEEVVIEQPKKRNAALASSTRPTRQTAANKGKKNIKVIGSGESERTEDDEIALVEESLSGQVEGSGSFEKPPLQRLKHLQELSRLVTAQALGVAKS